MAVTFMLEARSNKCGEHPIRFSICIRRVRLQTSIGFSIAKDKWVAALPDSPRKEKETKDDHAAELAVCNKWWRCRKRCHKRTT